MFDTLDNVESSSSLLFIEARSKEIASYHFSLPFFGTI